MSGSGGCAVGQGQAAAVRRSSLVDIHCHILPGLDDGPRGLAESLEMAKAAAKAGFDAIVATPHVMGGVFDATPAQIERAVAALQSKCDELGIGVSIIPGSEVYLDEDAPELARTSSVVPIGRKKKHLLVELPQHDMPHYTRELLFRISLAGYTPILAHPERNAMLRENSALAGELAAAGALLQLNAGSLTGTYGRRVRQTADRWLDEGLYSAIGSDWHSADLPNSLALVVQSGRPGIERLLDGNRTILG
jgi:protein-tyrosine phosphatase